MGTWDAAFKLALALCAGAMGCEDACQAERSQGSVGARERKTIMLGSKVDVLFFPFWL